mgnify:CR=1 FL=1
MLTITGNELKIQDVVRVARYNAVCSLGDVAKEQIQASALNLTSIVESGRTVYGVNTGFGCFAGQVLPRSQMDGLSRNLITSHAVAMGDPLPRDVVRASMLVRANTLAKGNSGVRLAIVQTLIDMLNEDVTPIVPCQGSLASSGDLCLLAHVALVFTEPVEDHDVSDGRVWYLGKEMSGKAAMAIANIPRLRLGPKEGLAIINGSTFSAAWGAMLVADAFDVTVSATNSLAMSLEAMCGVSAAYDERPHQARNEPGQVSVAADIRSLVAKSTLIDSQKRVQDAYSLRCAPQVHGPVKTNLEHVAIVIERELNASTDNPLIFGQETISAGNFHGEGIGFVMDLLKILMAELGAIAERRVARMVDPTCSNGLPPMLVDPKSHQGLNSGLMIPQYTAVSLVTENQALATPNTIHSLPTSANQEDHNSNAWNAVRAAARIVANTRKIIAIETFCAWRAIHQRMQASTSAKLGEGTQKLVDRVSLLVKYQKDDYGMHDDLIRVEEMLSSSPQPAAAAATVVDKTADKDDKHQPVGELKLGLPSGTRDLHPYQMRVREEVLSIITRAFKLAGAVQIDTPMFEKREILLGKYGSESKKLVFDLEDQGGQLLTLRFDLTVPLARYVAMNNLSKLKRFHYGPVFRRDSPSMEKGRFRQFYQFDFDNVGGGFGLMVPDAETIAVMSSVFDQLKLGEYTIKINHRALLTLLLTYCGVELSKHDMVCSSIDKLDKMTWEEVKTELLRKGIFPDVVHRIGRLMTVEGPAVATLGLVRAMVMEAAAKDSVFASGADLKTLQVLQELETLFGYLAAYGCLERVQFCLNLARGLSYYTGMIYEVVMNDKSLGIGSIGGGGRYDNLVGMFHPQGHQVPAVGGSIGIERIFAVLEAKSKSSGKGKDDAVPRASSSEVQVYVTSIKDEKAHLTADLMIMCRELRAAGIRTEMSYDAVPQMKDSLAHVLTNEIPLVIILGDTEKAQGTVILKDVRGRRQTPIPRASLVQQVQTALNL